MALNDNSPSINVVSKEEFEKRVESVFNLIWESLSRSFGPYGAPTIILDYPYSHVTKDGYTIMKNLMMDTSKTLIDQSIFNMASDVCGRLNYSVGDGTTTAVIATNSIYQRYRQYKKYITENFVLPREITRKFSNIKNDIEVELRSRSKEIRSDSPEELYNNIHDVVYISSNGDELITNLIADLYKELNFPAISCEIAQDGITRSDIIDGYKLNLCLNDKLYINSDEMVMNSENSDILIFGVRITQDIYEKILKPIDKLCFVRGRKLIVAAPYYDEVTLNQVIRCDLNNEYKQRKTVNMILTTYQATSNHDRTLINDFALLCNTMVIGRPLVKYILDELESGTPIQNILYMDSRCIPNTKCIFDHKETNRYGLYIYGVDTIPEGSVSVEQPIERSIPVGFVKKSRLGLDTSIFTGFYYDKNKYEILKADAYKEMKDLENKYQKLGTFNLEVSKAQQRYYALNLKMGVVYVGGDSELSQKMMKDTIDDAILAAASAFEHGVILGCNTTLLQSIEKIIKNEKYDEIDNILINILYYGFMDVYSTMLGNAFESIDLFEESSLDCYTILDDSDIYTLACMYNNKLNEFFKKDLKLDINILTDVVKSILDRDKSSDNGKYIELHDIIITYSIKANKVFDVSKMEWSDEIINSTQTDLEVLTAVIDLMGILISGNQLIVTNRHNF